MYGVVETNPITDEVVSFRDRIAGEVALDDPRLARIVRLRLVGEPAFPFLDLSYCYGELKDGTAVRVQLPRYQFGRRTYRTDIVNMCQQAKVYGKGLGIFDALSIMWG